MKKSIFIFSSLLLILLIYSFSLARGWQVFDERAIYDEILYPIPSSFKEIPEIIFTFGLNSHVESMNTFFSNIHNIRSNSLATAFLIFMSFFLKKSAFCYHFFSLVIHLINSLLVWLILYKFFKPSSPFLISIFTCLWALHGTNCESLFIATNISTIITYLFCFGFLLYELRVLEKSKKRRSLIEISIVSILFILTMFYTEYCYTFPFVLFFVIFSYSKSFKDSIRQVFPYITGLLLYVLISFFRTGSPLVNLINNNDSLSFLIERNLWFAPQIFLHDLKLIIFPKTLSVYQSNLVHLSDTLISPYSFICLFIYLSFLILPAVLFFKSKTLKYKASLIYAFYFSLFPFLHILIPTYCLSADRYIYFPLFFFLLLLFSILLSVSSKKPILQKATFIFLSLILLVTSIRTIIRIKEWKTPYTLYNSAINADKKHLYKGQKLIILGEYLSKLNDYNQTKAVLENASVELSAAIKELSALKDKFKNQPLTLKKYGLSYDSLLIKAAYALSYIKEAYLKESSQSVLAFYEPFIKNSIGVSFPNEITLYASLLANSGKANESVDILEKGLLLYPNSSHILFSLINFYLFKANDLEKSEKLINLASKWFKNDVKYSYLLYSYYEKRQMKENLADTAYLIGLRTHNPDSYTASAKLYLNLGDNVKAKKAMNKFNLYKN